MKPTTIIYTILFVLISHQICFAQATIHGNLKDEKDDVVMYTSVTLHQQTSSSLTKKAAIFTDSLGYFEFKNLDTGKYIVKVNSVGYFEQSSQIHITVDKKDYTVNLVLKQDVKQLSQVEIKGRKPTLERKIDRLIYNVENDASAAGNPLLDVLRMVPGISVDQDKLSVRGKEGLIVMIDGRRTYMSGDELLNYLKNTPAESIMQLEVITNPSSKYDAEGNVGIINIKTKKSNIVGTTGTLTQTFGYGKFFKLNTGGQVTYTNNKLTLYGNSYLSNNKSFDNYYSEQINTNATKIINNSYSEYLTKNNYSYQAGFDYSINKQNTIGMVTYGTFLPNFTSKSIDPLQKISSTSEYILTDKNSKTRSNNNSTNLHYAWNNVKNTHQFSTDFNYARYNSNLNDNQINKFYNTADYQTQLNSTQLRSQSIRGIDVISGKADYTYKFKTNTIESGIKWSRVETNSDLVYENLNGTGVWENDPGRTNTYKFTENIYAGYLNYNGQIGKLNVQAGLRAEQTNNTGYSKTLNSTITTDYFKLFPSLFLGNTFSKHHSWSASYSYRIDRPVYYYLNPFTFINNPYSYFRGNPYLLPDYTHNFEINYDFKKKFFVTATYGHTNGLITEVTEIGTDPDVIGGTRENLNSMDRFTFNINIPLEITKGWIFNVYLGVYKSIVKGSNNFKNQQTTFTSSFNTSINLPFKFSADFNGFYNSSSSPSTSLIDPTYMVNGGLKRSFLNNKLNVRLNVSDMFKLYKLGYSRNYVGVQSYGLNHFETRVARLTINYKFGNIKAATQRKTGVEEERRRAGN